jgi:hypothetical protein
MLVTASGAYLFVDRADEKCVYYFISLIVLLLINPLTIENYKNGLLLTIDHKFNMIVKLVRS